MLSNNEIDFHLVVLFNALYFKLLFEVGIGLRTHDFLIILYPSNSDCSISSHNGTTRTLFNISCSNWLDENTVKDC